MCLPSFFYAGRGRCRRSSICNTWQPGSPHCAQLKSQPASFSQPLHSGRPVVFTWTAAWVKPSSVSWSLISCQVDPVAPLKTPPAFCFWSNLCACFLGINPSLWDKADVAHWLHWAQKEYSLHRPEKGRFEMNGRALCLLTKEDFRHRCPNSGRWVCEKRGAPCQSALNLCFSRAPSDRWCSVRDPAVCEKAKEQRPAAVFLPAKRCHREPIYLPDKPSASQSVPVSHRQRQPRSGALVTMQFLTQSRCWILAPRGWGVYSRSRERHNTELRFNNT